MKQEHLEILKKYFPEDALDAVAGWFPRYRIHLTVTPARRSKHGDFRLEKQNGLNRISVNGSLNPYAFLITFTHEVAHLVSYRKYRMLSAPHGVQWKAAFRTLSEELPLRKIFPEDVFSAFSDYLKNPKASSDRHTALARALRRYDAPPGEGGAAECAVEDLAPGERFVFGEKRRFQVVEKRRRLYLCRELDTGKKYLFQPHAYVNPLKEHLPTSAETHRAGEA